MMRVLAALFSCVFLLCAQGPAFAKKHALLIGVADYDSPSIRPLTGPRNDVILLWRYLTANGFDAKNIRVLVEGLPEHASVPRAFGAPTRAQIMDGFADLAERAQPDDFVVISFSGHGTTQPETARSIASGPEAGDRDQVLLPKDAGGYDTVSRSIRNGIVDDEIGEALDRIRAKGAIVWAIIDACHAGTVTRSGAVATRGTQPESLGVPKSPALRSGAARAHGQRTATVQNLGGKASLIGFFAVDSWTEAIEREFQFTGVFAPGPNGGPPRFGVFTYHLVRALNSGRARTFRDLARVVSLDIASSGAIAQAPLPYFDGDLDRTLSGGEAQFASRFPASFEDGKFLIDAGSLHGFDTDSVVGLFDGPLDDARRIGSARITSADAARSIAEVAGDPPQQKTNLWAMVQAPGISLRYRVGAIADAESDRARILALLRAALRNANGGPAIAVELVENGERDLEVRLADGRLWLTAEGQPFITDPNAYDRSLAIALGGGDEQAATDLRKALFAFARAANLVRVASAAELAGGSNDDVQIRLERVRESDPAALSNPKRACGELSMPTPAVAVASGGSTTMSHCDEAHISITNRGDRDMLVSVLYLTPTGGVAVADPKWRQDGCITLVAAKSTRPLTLRTPLQTWTRSGPSYTGPHRVLIFAIPRTQTAAPNLCHLLQPDVASARKEVVALRSKGARPGLLGLLDRVASSDPSLRGGANPFEDSPQDASSVVVRQFTLDLRPPAEN
ncbi:MAG: caspase domain-containing protein [Beijerinckiaceae bacterium]